MRTYEGLEAERRFRLLLNGFANGASFSSIDEAMPAFDRERRPDILTELYDARDRRHVFAGQRVHGADRRAR